MRHKNNFNPRHYKIKDFSKIINKKNNKSNIDKLFEKIKISDKINKLPIQHIGSNSNLDDRLLNDQNNKKFVIITSENKENNMGKMPQDNVNEYENPMYHIVCNNTLLHTVDYDDILKKYLNIIEKIEDEYSYCQNKVTEADREIQDFLHELRTSKKSASEGYKLYKLGHYLEIKRQGYKDHAIYLKYILNHILYIKSKIDVDNLKNTINMLNNLKDSQKNKIYMPRSNLQLSVGDKFRALSKEEQNFIRDNYEKNKQKKKE